MGQPIYCLFPFFDQFFYELEANISSFTFMSPKVDQKASLVYHCCQRKRFRVAFLEFLAILTQLYLDLSSGQHGPCSIFSITILSSGSSMWSISAEIMPSMLLVVLLMLSTPNIIWQWGEPCFWNSMTLRYVVHFPKALSLMIALNNSFLLIQNT